MRVLGGKVMCQIFDSFVLHKLSEDEIIQQKQSFNALLEELKQTSFDHIQSILADREKVEPEPELTPEIINAFQQMIRVKMKL